MAVREQIEECYLSGDFKKASDLCYEHLCSISEPLEVDPAFSKFNPLLKHECSSANCSCEHFLSLAAQFMFELRYPPDYISSFLTNFYYRETHLPLVCVGLLSGILIHQKKYREARSILEDAINRTKAKPEPWTKEEVEKYQHVLSILLLHVLIPLGYTGVAKEYLQDSKHPPAALPLGKTLKEDIFLAIEKKNREFERQFVKDSDDVFISPIAAVKGRRKPSTSTKSSSSAKATVARVNNKKNPKKLGNVTRFKNLCMMQLKSFGTLLIPTATLLSIIVFVVFILKRQQKTKSWITSVWDLLENAFVPNSNIRRLQRQHQPPM